MRSFFCCCWDNADNWARIWLLSGIWLQRMLSWFCN